MKLRTPEELYNVLKEIGEIGGKNVYLVGGAVRDIILNVRESEFTPTDIDIVVEGDAIQVAKELKTRWHGTLQKHTQFGTATVTSKINSTQSGDVKNKLKVDFVTARRETYQIPATLPIVEKGSLADDLGRRDFTINSVAMRLDLKAFGAVVDTTGGIKDIKTGIIRTHHKKSYIDDPTRIFRACRYAGRYNFRISETDKTLIKEAVRYISKLSGERIRNEIDRILIEKNAAKIIDLLNDFCVFDVIFPGPNISWTLHYDYLTAQNAITWASKHMPNENFRPHLLRWMLLCGTGNTNGVPPFLINAISFKLVLEHKLNKIASQIGTLHNQDECATKNAPESEQGIRKSGHNYGLSISENADIQCHNGKWCIVDTENQETYVQHNNTMSKVQTPLTAYRTLLNTLQTLDSVNAPSKIYQLLKPFPLEALVLGYSDENLSNTLKQKIADYLLKWRNVKPIITGNDLIQWGEKPGKTIAPILKKIFAAQLDGKINSKSEAYSKFKTLRESEMKDRDSEIAPTK